MHSSSLKDRDLVLLVAVILVLVAIVLVCCKQSVPAALLVIFVMAMLVVSMDSSGKVYVKEDAPTPTVTAPKMRAQMQNLQHPVLQYPQHILPMQPQPPMLPPHNPCTVPGAPPMEVPSGMYNDAMTMAIPRTYCDSSNIDNPVPVKEVTVTNVPVAQSDPQQPPKVCSINSAYTEFNRPPMNSTAINTYQDLFVVPTEVSRPEGKSIAQVQAKTKLKCMKKELEAFPKPDKMHGTDVFAGEDTPIQLELARLQQQVESNSLITQPAGSSTLDAALQVSPKPRPDYNYVNALPNYDKDMKQKIRNEGLYGIHGDTNCQQMRRSAVADKGFVQPLNARYEFLRYLAYDMPNYRNQWQTARPNTVNYDTRYFK